jgi:hypothetical protein
MIGLLISLLEGVLRMITGLTLYVQLDRHHDWTLIPIEPKVSTIPVLKAIVDGMVTQGYGATLHIETQSAEVYTGPAELADPDLLPSQPLIEGDDRPPPLAVGTWNTEPPTDNMPPDEGWRAPRVVSDQPQA